MVTKNKVLAYIFRNNDGVRELLVFDHRDYLDVNPQVPAGTVDKNEKFEKAILREIHEETGLDLKKHSSYLGCFNYSPKGLAESHKRRVYSFEVKDLPDKWGHTVTNGKEDKGLVFNFYWLPVEDAREKIQSGNMWSVLKINQLATFSFTGQAKLATDGGRTTRMTLLELTSILEK